MMTTARVLALSAFGAALSVAAPAAATLVQAVPLDQMTRESDVIVHARVGGQQVTWDKDHRRVLTLTTIEVLDAVKGASKGDRLTIYQVGGTLDGVTYRIVGALQFVPGEQMVFFAKRFEDKLVSYGMGLGKYAVTEQNGKLQVAPAYGDVAFVKRAADGTLVDDAQPPTGVQPLTAFLRNLRAIAGRGGAR